MFHNIVSKALIGCTILSACQAAALSENTLLKKKPGCHKTTAKGFSKWDERAFSIDESTGSLSLVHKKATKNINLASAFLLNESDPSEFLTRGKKSIGQPCQIIQRPGERSSSNAPYLLLVKNSAALRQIGSKCLTSFADIPEERPQSTGVVGGFKNLWIGIQKSFQEQQQEPALRFPSAVEFQGVILFTTEEEGWKIRYYDLETVMEANLASTDIREAPVHLHHLASIRRRTYNHKFGKKNRLDKIFYDFVFQGKSGEEIKTIVMQEDRAAIKSASSHRSKFEEALAGPIQDAIKAGRHVRDMFQSYLNDELTTNKFEEMM